MIALKINFKEKFHKLVVALFLATAPLTFAIKSMEREETASQSTEDWLRSQARQSLEDCLLDYEHQAEAERMRSGGANYYEFLASMKSQMEQFEIDERKANEAKAARRHEAPERKVKTHKKPSQFQEQLTSTPASSSAPRASSQSEPIVKEDETTVEGLLPIDEFSSGPEIMAHFDDETIEQKDTRTEALIKHGYKKEIYCLFKFYDSLLAPENSHVNLAFIMDKESVFEQSSRYTLTLDRLLRSEKQYRLGSESDKQVFANIRGRLQRYTFNKFKSYIIEKIHSQDLVTVAGGLALASKIFSIADHLYLSMLYEVGAQEGVDLLNPWDSTKRKTDASLKDIVYEDLEFVFELINRGLEIAPQIMQEEFEQISQGKKTRIIDYPYVLGELISTVIPNCKEAAYKNPAKARIFRQNYRTLKPNIAILLGLEDFLIENDDTYTPELKQKWVELFDQITRAKQLIKER